MKVMKVWYLAHPIAPDEVYSKKQNLQHILDYTKFFLDMDGIHSYVKGHKSQRESVEGRINDAIVYLCLLRCMVEDSKKKGDLVGMSNAQRQGVPGILGGLGERNPTI